MFKALTLAALVVGIARDVCGALALSQTRLKQKVLPTLEQEPAN